MLTRGDSAVDHELDTEAVPPSDQGWRIGCVPCNILCLKDMSACRQVEGDKLVSTDFTMCPDSSRIGSENFRCPNIERLGDQNGINGGNSA
jgi:hypothetical protein